MISPSCVSSAVFSLKVWIRVIEFSTLATETLVASSELDADLLLVSA